MASAKLLSELGDISDHVIYSEVCGLYVAAGGVRKRSPFDLRASIEPPFELGDGPGLGARAVAEEDARLGRCAAHSDSARSWNFCIISGSCESAKAFWISSAMGSDSMRGGAPGSDRNSSHPGAPTIARAPYGTAAA